MTNQPTKRLFFLFRELSLDNIIISQEIDDAAFIEQIFWVTNWLLNMKLQNGKDL